MRFSETVEQSRLTSIRSKYYFVVIPNHIIYSWCWKYGNLESELGQVNYQDQGFAGEPDILLPMPQTEYSFNMDCSRSHRKSKRADVRINVGRSDRANGASPDC
jgi:hypothetical protein